MCPGSNPAVFDIMGALQHWVEEGTAPDQVTMSYSNSGRVYKTHPVCVYPEVAIYKGEGDINDASNFTCGTPTW